MATVGSRRRDNQWSVGFALETEDARFRALTKLQRKSCDLIVLNGPEAMNALHNNVEIIDRTGAVIRELGGSKETVAQGILAVVQEKLIDVIGQRGTRQPDES